ncbi:MAG TPA: Minf_1886 family protein [Gemmataceae bacterium]|jgi:uncharacterized repeat protein (TIGR04138 family)|nr:Minf_1886 family protein [Gemmataceae bacterium]
MTMFHPRLAEIVRRDPRYAYEAYEFVFAALAHTQKMLGHDPAEEPGAPNRPQRHVSGPELLEGIRDLALRQFGLMARTVFRLWGINRTDDFGEIVFNLIEARLMSKTDSDSRADFHNVYDLDQALVRDYRIELDREALAHDYPAPQGPAE